MNKGIIFIIIGLAFQGCGSRIDAGKIPGVWELAGDRCDEQGQCKREIYTDADSREKFTTDGLYLSPHMRTRYTVQGGAIYFADDKNQFTIKHADIVRIDEHQLLLKNRSVIRRYSRVSI